VVAQRALNMPANADAAEPGNAPEQNGANNAKKSPANSNLSNIAREVLSAAN
jgi:hypothetical protein